jgi:hypothetical protein
MLVPSALYFLIKQSNTVFVYSLVKGSNFFSHGRPKPPVNPMSESQHILAKICATNFCQASQDFPPAELCKEEFMEAQSMDVNGRPVIIKFRRTLYKRHKTSWHAWSLYSARYVEPASVGDLP